MSHRSSPRPTMVCGPFMTTNSLHCAAEKFQLRLRHHFHGPNGGGAHVHGSAIVTVDIPSFGSAEPVAFFFIAGVIDALDGFIGLVFHAVAEHESGNAHGGSRPD